LNADLTEAVKKEIIEKLEEAFILGKKMDAKLRQYKNNYDDTWYKKQTKEVIAHKKELRSNRNDK
jgi:hypothetical protein